MFFLVFSSRSHEFLFWQNSFFMFLIMRLWQGTIKSLFNVFLGVICAFDKEVLCMCAWLIFFGFFFG